MITKSAFENNTPDWANGPSGYYERGISLWNIANACVTAAYWKWLF
jgi:hypothetical protein